MFFPQSPPSNARHWSLGFPRILKHPVLSNLCMRVGRFWFSLSSRLFCQLVQRTDLNIAGCLKQRTTGGKYKELSATQVFLNNKKSTQATSIGVGENRTLSGSPDDFPYWEESILEYPVIARWLRPLRKMHACIKKEMKKSVLKPLSQSQSCSGRTGGQGGNERETRDWRHFSCRLRHLQNRERSFSATTTTATTPQPLCSCFSFRICALGNNREKANENKKTKQRRRRQGGRISFKRVHGLSYLLGSSGKMLMSSPKKKNRWLSK